MKKLFTLVLLSSMVALASCSQKAAEGTAADSAKVDSAATAVVDSATAIVDSAAAAVDTTKK
jgi:hypothetical protein